MNIFEGLIGNWIQVIDDKNNLTIEDYCYNTGIIEGTTDNHCIKCVAVNQCYFKNEQGKKPEWYNIVKNKTISDVQEFIFGLYHPYCHCVETSANIEKIEDIELIVPLGKITYMFNNKHDWINIMGYHQNDYDEFVLILKQKTKEAYFYGEYYIEEWSKYGCKINLKVSIPGKNEKIGKVYKIETNYMIFPDKKLKMNTPLGEWQK